MHVRSAHDRGEETQESDDDSEALWKTVPFNHIHLKPKEGVVVTYVPDYTA